MTCRWCISYKEWLGFSRTVECLIWFIKRQHDKMPILIHRIFTWTNPSFTL